MKSTDILFLVPNAKASLIPGGSFCFLLFQNSSQLFVICLLPHLEYKVLHTNITQTKYIHTKYYDVCMVSDFCCVRVYVCVCVSVFLNRYYYNCFPVVKVDWMLAFVLAL